MQPYEIKCADDARAVFSGFYENPCIRSLAPERAWTLSDDNKMPLHAGDLLSGAGIYGCSLAREGALVTLDELTRACPLGRYPTLRVEGHIQGWCVLDVEKTSTPETRRAMLGLPWAYAERSRSGVGMHLIIPWPAALMEKYPAAKTKSVIKGPRGEWELLLRDHFVILTRDVIDARPGTDSIDAVLGPLFAGVRDTCAELLDVGDLPEPAAIEGAEAAMASMSQVRLPDMDDCDDDASRYDYNTAIRLARRLRRLERESAAARMSGPRGARPLVWTCEERCALVLAAMRSYGRPRDKWYAHRVHGKPWVVYTVTHALSYVYGNESERS